MNKNIVVPIVVGVVAVSGGFVGGIKYQEFSFSKNMQNRFSGMRSFNGTNPPGGVRAPNGRNPQMGFRPTSGEVIKSDATSLTLKLADGSSKLILFSDSTKVSETTDTSINNVKVGAKVAVMGTTNADGSITAQSLQINPFMGLMGVPEGVATTTPTIKK